MGYSYVNYTGDGSTANFTVPFPYLTDDSLYVTVDGIGLACSLVGPGTLHVTPTPAALSAIQIYRNTVAAVVPVDFTDGSVLLEKDMDKLARYLLYTSQEAYERNGGVISGYSSGGGGGGSGTMTGNDILAAISGMVNVSHFAASLANEIAKISGTSALIGSVAWQLLQEAIARQAAINAASYDLTQVINTKDLAQATAVQAVITTMTSNNTTLAASVVSEQTARSTAVSALATRVTALEGSVVTQDGTAVAAMIAAQDAIVVTREGAIASNVSTLQASMTGVTTTQSAQGTTLTGHTSQLSTVQTQANVSTSKIGVTEANWSLKVQSRADSKLAVAGIGLLTTANSTVAQSELILMADKVQFISAINDTPQVLLQSGLVNGSNTLIIPSTKIGDLTIAARMIVDGSVTASKMDTKGLIVRKADGTPMFGDGVSLAAAYITPAAGWLNSNITPANIGAMSAGARNVLSAGVGFSTGPTWDAAGNYTGGAGIAINNNGIVGFDGTNATFIFNGITGAANITGTLRVGSTPAVSGTTMTGSGAVINTNGTFALGTAATNITYNGTTLTLNGNVVTTASVATDAITESQTNATGVDGGTTNNSAAYGYLLNHTYYNLPVGARYLVMAYGKGNGTGTNPQVHFRITANTALVSEVTVDVDGVGTNVPWTLMGAGTVTGAGTLDLKLEFNTPGAYGSSTAKAGLRLATVVFKK